MDTSIKILNAWWVQSRKTEVILGKLNQSNQSNFKSIHPQTSGEIVLIIISLDYIYLVPGICCFLHASLSSQENCRSRAASAP